MANLPMTPVLFTRNMTRTRQDGVQFPLSVNFGTPDLVPNPTPGTIPMYYCPIQLIGFQDDSIRSIYGIDPLEALMMATSYVGPLLGMLPYASTIDDWDASINFGFPTFDFSPEGPFVSGTVQMEMCNDPAQNITFEFRTPGTSPYDPTNPVPALQTVQQILTPLTPGGDTGSFSIPEVPDGAYDLAIKGYCWLRKVIPGVVVNGANVSGLSAFLIGGDINNDNIVDSTDFGTVIGDYGTQGDP